MPQLKLRPLAALLLVCALAVSVVPGRADARSVTWVRASDAPTLDPHAVDEGVSLTLLQQIYEPLLLRDAAGKTSPALAESWNLTSDPQVWEFRLRRGVTFHDGKPFTADDVIFSVNRAREQASGIAGLLASIEQVSAVDSHTVRLKTRGPTPLLPASLTHLLVMSKAWAEQNGAASVSAPAQRHQAFTWRNANGTGPFVLISREVGSRTVMRRYDAYWGNTQAPVEITELNYVPIPNDTERVQALVSGEADFLQDVPVNELPRLQANKAFTVNVGPENRTVYIGINVGPPTPSGVGAESRNPLADKRVRDAINAAINRQAIQRTVLLGQAIPTGVVAPSSVNGYPRLLDRIPPHDPVKAKAAIAEAGWPNGFKLTLDCPREGVLRSEAICRALATQLGQIGVTVEVSVRDWPRAQPVVAGEPLAADLFLAGMNVSSFDSEQMLLDLFHSRTEKAGRFNFTRYQNPDLDKVIDSLASQIDFSQRTQAMTQAWRIAHEDTIYIPLHIQTVAYVMKADLTINTDIENQPKLKFTRVRMPIQ